jgi:hypothetical protein
MTVDTATFRGQLHKGLALARTSGSDPRRKWIEAPDSVPLDCIRLFQSTKFSATMAVAL